MTRPLTPRSAARLFFAAMAVTACSGGDGGTAPPKPASVQAVSAATPTATVATALTTSPTFTVTDAGGAALGGVAVSVVVGSGGGTLVGAPTKTQAGPTPAGTWTLGTTAGANTLTVTVSGLTPLIITATGTPGAPAKIVVTAGSGQTALAGASVATALGAAVQDQFSNGIPNIAVTFQSSAGGGSVTPALLTTDASGVASGASWRLGNKGGTQTATASANGFAASFSATIQTSFPLILRFFTPMSAEAQLAFTNAANRIRAAIITQVTPVILNDNLVNCDSLLTGTINETTQGVIIYAGVTHIDGAGKILGQAGPCGIRPSSKLPALGTMYFDEADIQSYINSGSFEALVLHEMNHVVGLGTIWEPPFLDFLTGAGTSNPRFMGPRAVANCATVGGLLLQCTASTGVAVENTGGGGTRDSHWRESLFDSELMTGFAESTPNMPWSVMSIASLQDLGYTVNLLAADSYSVPSLLAMARMSLQAEGAADGPREVVHRAKFEIAGDGRLRTINPEKK